MSNKSIDEQLAERRACLNDLLAQMKHRVVSVEYDATLQEILRFERQIAERDGLAYAARWEIPDIWNGMTLDCIVLGDQSRCLVVFEIRPMSGEFKIVEFRGIAGYKLTDVSDEIIEAHSLTGRGLAAYGAFIIENSPWLNEMELIDRSHPQFDQKRWQLTKHYLLCFKDRMFEALALEAVLIGEANARDTAISMALKRLLSDRR